VSDLAIQANALSKGYRIGLREKYSTIREALVRAAVKPFHASRSFWNGRDKAARLDWFWALRDVTLEVKQGEVLGIIGRNGAGKSTFLKVLAGISDPTEGWADIHGRVGCLLEVGTGFHMELTGRENVFMNGALLGLSRQEIRRRFDEIVGFAEVDKFIDTPVKHYSSGMYMRLAFAVAAHLDPEILIIDEVLAVGDAQFQKKCLGKMEDVSKNQGRTVLFVSHNMDAIQRLCSRCALFDGGHVVAHGDTADVVARYLSNSSARTRPHEWIDVSRASRVGTGEAHFTDVWYSGLEAAYAFRPYTDGPLQFRLAISSDAPRTIDSLAVTLLDVSGTRLVNIDVVLLDRTIQLHAGRNVVTLRIEQLHLNPGTYKVALWLANPRSVRGVRGVYDYVESAFDVEVVRGGSERSPLSPNAAVACRFELVDVAHGPETAVAALVTSTE
jgi:homopolymeric O-antigen transport system ATP-binding protein